MPVNDLYDEKILIQDFSAGKEDAFAAIYQKYAPGLTGFAAERVFSLEEARDIIQDLFVYLWEERANIKITHSLQAFLFAATRYRIIDHIRHNMAKEKYAERLNSLSQTETTGIENKIAAKELHIMIENAVNDLPPRVKEVYRLSREKHLSIKEIANQLNLSPQTVKNQITTALSFLRSCMDKFKTFLWLF